MLKVFKINFLIIAILYCAGSYAIPKKALIESIDLENHQLVVNGKALELDEKVAIYSHNDVLVGRRALEPGQFVEYKSNSTKNNSLNTTKSKVVTIRILSSLEEKVINN